MSKLISQLAELRESLRTADAAEAASFAEVFSAFLDLTETAELVDLSKPIKDKGIRPLLDLVVRRHANDPTLAVTNLHMLKHAPSSLFHGGFFVGNRPGTFFYFVQEMQGIVALQEGRTTHYYRISATELPPGMVIGKKRFSMN